MQLESGETLSALWKGEQEVEIQAYGIAVEPGRFVLCWTCHVMSADASQLSDHLSQAHREEPGLLELTHPGERAIRVSDLTEEDVQRGKELGEIAREHAVDLDEEDRDMLNSLLGRE